MNNPVWLMTSAFRSLQLDAIIETTHHVGAQGLELCVFRRDGSRKDHVATHLDYEIFSNDDAKQLLDRFQSEQLRFSIGAYENLIGGDADERLKNQNHLLALIRIAALCGGDRNDVKVGTFVGYNHELGIQDGGFEKNLMEYKKVFSPIVRYAEDLGVTILYENCPMEGWMPSSWPTTYNNLPGCLAARKLMYEIIPSSAHGETYDPSHDVWQNINPVEVIERTDFTKLHRVHVKATRNVQSESRVYWGGMYPAQHVDSALAQKANVPIPSSDWDRHHYIPMLPGFGGSDSMDWHAFLQKLMDKEFNGPFVIENEADNSAHTGNLKSTIQGFHATVLNLSPVIWNLHEEHGYCRDNSNDPKWVDAKNEEIPLITMSDLT